MAKSNTSANAVSEIIAIVEPLTVEDRRRVLSAVVGFFRADGTDSTERPSPATWNSPQPSSPRSTFTTEATVSPKQFMLEKRPQTDIERLACLAYYLTHYRDAPQFKTVDLTRLNTEAAQVRFSNPSLTASNALKRGYLAHASQGNKQLSAVGEAYVQALPDRDAARTILSSANRKRRSSRRKAKE